tara:strand:+ start:1166 stop:2626 length:1461 start_codon:yes stop_codon:yes gene_type:complete
MKKTILSTVLATVLTFTAFGQAPEGFKYQAVVRDAGNTILVSQAVGVQLTIQQGSIGGTAVYTETFAPTTNGYGLINLEIGTGTSADDFTIIDWANGPYFIETAVDVAGGTAYVVMGTAQLMSVPYALHAKTAENVTNDMVNDADADSTNELQTLSIAGDTLTISNGNNVILPSGAGLGDWIANGSDIYNANAGNVGVGFTSTPRYTLSVGRSDTTTALAVGYVGGFNQIHSGRLVFEEDLSYTGGYCGLLFEMNGASNNLNLMGGCSALDTIARFNRSGYSNIKQLRVGTNLFTNASSQLNVDGNSDFTGDMTITGNLNVTGNIAKGGGTFKIDHPLDPTNKYLVHSFVESPEMMNVYSGNITTDANGYATVTMPNYFEAANKDFRYQLTVMGSFAQAIVKEKVSNNKFVIQTNNPNVEVSWQVTSVRADKYANENRVVPELEKELKGTYIHPELYGASAENSEAARKAKIALDAQVEKVGADNQ